MELKMFIAGHLVATLPVDAFRLHVPGYINHLCEEMQEDHDDLIDLSKEQPQFFIDTLPSRMNWHQQKPQQKN